MKCLLESILYDTTEMNAEYGSIIAKYNPEFIVDENLGNVVLITINSFEDLVELETEIEAVRCNYPSPYSGISIHHTKGFQNYTNLGIEYVLCRQDNYVD